jgi:hypothetical protein
MRRKAILTGRGGSRLDLNGRRQSGNQANAVRHTLDADSRWYALRKPNPGEDWVDVCKPGPIRLRIRHRNTARDTADFAQNDTAVSHQLDLRRIPFVDRRKSCLFEVGIDPE